MDWDQIQNLLSNFVFAMLNIAMLCYWISFYFFKEINFISNFGKLSAFTSNIMLICILYSRWIVAGYFPLSNLYESLLFLTWALLTVYLYIELKTESKIIGAILIPIALLINGFANLTLPIEMQKASPLVPALQSNWLMLHVSMMIVSYATLIIGSLMCILFLAISEFKEENLVIDVNSELSKLPKELIVIKYHNKIFLSQTIFGIYDLEKRILACKEMLKTIKIEVHLWADEIFNLGKLQLLYKLDNWSYRTIGLGFPFLTIGIISGAVWANEAWGSYWSWDPKETWALITWLVFTSYLHARIAKSWKGTKTAILGSLGFFVIWICYLGVNFLGKGLHSYGWVN